MAYVGSIEEEAYLQFLDKFFMECSDNDAICFTPGNLRDLIHDKCIAQNGLVLLYLHNISDEFSINFLNFLKDPSVHNLFREELFSLLPWNIGFNDCRHILADTIGEILGVQFSDFINSEKAAVLLIGNDDDKPAVLNIFQEPIELINLHTQLNKYKSASDSDDDGKVTPKNFQQNMLDQLGDRDYDCFESNEHEFLKKKIGFALYGPPKENEGNYSQDQQKDVETLYVKIVKHNGKFQDGSNLILLITIIF